jgi:hypothetical protein
MSRTEARVRRVEHRIRPLPAEIGEIWREVPKHLTVEEIETGQAALAHYDGDPLAALEAGDPVLALLVLTRGGGARNLGAAGRREGGADADLLLGIRWLLASNPPVVECSALWRWWHALQGVGSSYLRGLKGAERWLEHQVIKQPVPTSL